MLRVRHTAQAPEAGSHVTTESLSVNVSEGVCECGSMCVGVCECVWECVCGGQTVCQSVRCDPCAQL